MAKKKSDESKRSFLLQFLGLFIFLMLLAVVTSIYQITKPQDLSDVKKHIISSETEISPPREIATVLAKSIEGKFALTLTERELNEWLHHKLNLKQGGLFAEWIVLRGAYIRLNKEIAEIIIERDVAGFPLTTSMFLKIEQRKASEGISTQVHLHGGSFSNWSTKPVRGGRFGQLTVPQGFLMLVIPDFQKLAEVFTKEIELGFERMAYIRIEEKKLFLDPNSPKKTMDEVGF